jgi:hypothetical protein
MSRLVPAYDTRTGTKLTHFVPEHWIGHPKFGRHLSRTPASKAGRKAAPAATNDTPAAGDKKE